MRKISLIFSLAFLLWGCDSFEYSPNQAFDNDTPRDLNKVNLEKLFEAVPDDTVTIAFVGDTQRFYDEVQDFINKVNEYPSVDFVFLAGDISDFGLLNEYEWINEAFFSLKAPYLTVIGNHDLVGNGEDVFQRMFGPLNYSFVYDSVKFVVHNTNGREYLNETVPDISWLKQEFKGEASASGSRAHKYFVAVSHVPPTDGDFDQALVQPYGDLFASTPGFLVSLHGHIHEHTDHYPFNDGVRYITSYAFPDRNFLLLKIVNGNVIKESIPY